MDGLQHLRRRVLDQVAYCRLPVAANPVAGLTADDIRAVRREELGARLAVYRTYRRALVRS